MIYLEAMRHTNLHRLGVTNIELGRLLAETQPVGGRSYRFDPQLLGSQTSGLDIQNGARPLGLKMAGAAWLPSGTQLGCLSNRLFSRGSFSEINSPDLTNFGGKTVSEATILQLVTFILVNLVTTSLCTTGTHKNGDQVKVLLDHKYLSDRLIV